MYKLCKTEQSAKRQRQLEMGLLEAMQTQRYEDISISDLCDRMKIPRKSFYRYFSSKDGALVALMDHTMMSFFEAGYRSGKEGSALGDLEGFFRFWYENKALLDALQRSQLSGLLVERARSFALRERLMPRQLQNRPTEVQGIALSFAVCGLMSVVIQWHHEGYLIRPEKMTQIATSMLTQPLIQP